MKGSEKGMIGDKRLEMPETVREAGCLMREFGFKTIGLVSDEVTMFNAVRLVELNNQVFDNYVRI